MNPFNIREKVEICERKDDRKIRQMYVGGENAAKVTGKKSAKNVKQFSQVMASTDSHGIRKLGHLAKNAIKKFPRNSIGL